MFTGAGISTGSGIPDFRGPQGVWTKRKPVYYQEFMSSEAARIEYWEFKLEGAEVFGRARPNAVHSAIRKLEDAGKLSMVLTQNVDGLHAMAGTSPQRLLELHGTNAEVECQSCGWRDDPRVTTNTSRLHRRRRSANAADFSKLPPSASVKGWTRACSSERGSPSSTATWWSHLDRLSRCGLPACFLSRLRAEAFLTSSSTVARPTTTRNLAFRCAWTAMSWKFFRRRWRPCSD